MNNINEEKIVSIEIDLEELKRNKLDESFITMFGSAIKLLMGYLTRQPGGHLKGRYYNVSGKRKDVESFAKTLGSEKKYLDAMKKHGLQDEKTFKYKSTLDKAIKGFEKTTGIKWPFK